jgi:hypothetical protein
VPHHSVTARRAPAIRRLDLGGHRGILAEYKKRPSDLKLNHGPDNVARAPRRQRSGRALGESACHDWSIEENSIELAASGIQADFASVYGAVEAAERRIPTAGRARHGGVSVRGRRGLAHLRRCECKRPDRLNPCWRRCLASMTHVRDVPPLLRRGDLGPAERRPIESTIDRISGVARSSAIPRLCSEVPGGAAGPRCRSGTRGGVGQHRVPRASSRPFK